MENRTQSADHLLSTEAEIPLPYTLKVKGKFWYFRTRKHGTIRLRGKYRSPAFMRHYEELLAKHGKTPETRGADQREVYFIGWDGGPIKIGISGSNADRVTTLQNACPYKLEILATTKGGRALEWAYHRRFKQWHMRGEWFARCPEIEAEIDRLNSNPSESNHGR